MSAPEGCSSKGLHFSSLRSLQTTAGNQCGKIRVKGHKLDDRCLFWICSFSSSSTDSSKFARFLKQIPVGYRVRPYTTQTGVCTYCRDDTTLDLILRCSGCSRNRRYHHRYRRRRHHQTSRCVQYIGCLATVAKMGANIRVTLKGFISNGSVV